MKIRNSAAAALALAAVIATGCGSRPGSSTITDRSRLERFAPLPEVVPAKAGPPSEAMVTLGRMLYFDARLSRSQTVSCNSCHPLDRFGADGQATSTGFRGQHGDRNSPSVYNAAAQFVQFWDGRAEDVEEQAKGPMLNPVEMAMPSGDAVVKVLQSMPEYVAAFRHAFPDDRNPVSFDHAGQAIGAFERRLMTPARWDRFLRGEETALTAEEKRGFNVFVDEGCANCHTGVLVGGDAFQRLGAARPYPDTSDPGRYKVTKKDSDRMLFKVPPLRNIAQTGPYFHNGKVATLEEAVTLMATYQLDRHLDAARTSAIVAWLKSLDGQPPADYMRQPELPRSTPRTPQPAAD